MLFLLWTLSSHDDASIHLTDSASQSRMDVDDDDAPFELTEQDDLALANAYAHAHALPDAQAQAFDAYAADRIALDDLLRIDDPDLLDIPPPMMYEARSGGDEECGTQ